MNCRTKNECDESCQESKGKHPRYPRRSSTLRPERENAKTYKACPRAKDGRVYGEYR
ncbi:hypothetical protein KOR34_16440 [Posidoniimonas corsicana]|uniref:Uncharacterized protein n=1 Tax=Posidoniimonas corsicana TaxID=1938618 RepID=A0A5C5VDL4_9BACT|nr:hypothetical protein [Posidoniimonas corsicana]TWT36704.1 hypothetical protein KOR34_16440 [Posidoniimonas corsicana]